MKYIVKTKPGKTLVSRNVGEYLDEYRYRVFTNVVEVREWDSRKLLDIYGQVDDSATDAELADMLKKDKEKGLEKFAKKYSLEKKAAPAQKTAPAQKEGDKK